MNIQVNERMGEGFLFSLIFFSVNQVAFIKLDPKKTAKGQPKKARDAHPNEALRQSVSFSFLFSFRGHMAVFLCAWLSAATTHVRLDRFLPNCFFTMTIAMVLQD